MKENHISHTTPSLFHVRMVLNTVSTRAKTAAAKSFETQPNSINAALSLILFFRLQYWVPFCSCVVQVHQVAFKRRRQKSTCMHTSPAIYASESQRDMNDGTAWEHVLTHMIRGSAAPIDTTLVSVFFSLPTARFTWQLLAFLGNFLFSQLFLFGNCI